jgi:hypothetical protein
MLPIPIVLCFLDVPLYNVLLMAEGILGKYITSVVVDGSSE